MLTCGYLTFGLPAALRAQVHLNKRLPSGERRAYAISEEEFHDLAFQFQRFSGAMLANLVNTAVILAGRQGRMTVKHDDLVEVWDMHACMPRAAPAVAPFCIHPARRGCTAAHACYAHASCIPCTGF
jgi:ATP-dependent Zn protease